MAAFMQDGDALGPERRGDRLPGSPCQRDEDCLEKRQLCARIAVAASRAEWRQQSESGNGNLGNADMIAFVTGLRAYFVNRNKLYTTCLWAVLSSTASGKTGDASSPHSAKAWR